MTKSTHAHELLIDISMQQGFHGFVCLRMQSTAAGSPSPGRLMQRALAAGGCGGEHRPDQTESCLNDLAPGDVFNTCGPASRCRSSSPLSVGPYTNSDPKVV